MEVTLPLLLAAGLGVTQARAFAEPLREACARFEINTPQRIAGFIGQCRVESVNFTALEENLRYRTPTALLNNFRAVRDDADALRLIARGPQAIANRVYANRNGNGDEASGDGWRYRGRGLIQLTGRDNYAAAAAGCGVLYLEQPDLVAQPEHAALTAAWFWARAGCNGLADARDWDGCTRRVNGPAMLHAAERRAYSDEAEAALSVVA